MEGLPAEGEPSQAQEPRQNKSYTMQFKLQVIKEAKETSKRAAARPFIVDIKRVREWVESKDRLCDSYERDKWTEQEGNQVVM